MSEEIILPPFSVILPGQNIVKPSNCVNLSMNFNATGGNFSITLLRGALSLLAAIENAQLTLPNGRIATIKSTGQGFSSGGIVDTISGPIVPPAATLVTLVGEAGNVFTEASLLAEQLAAGFGVSWGVFNPLVRSFIFRGVALSGIQQLAGIVAAEVIVRADGVHVVAPGSIIGPTFTVPKTDIVSATQVTDYSLDTANVLNPALSAVQLVPQGQFVYDSEHCQKQAAQTVQTGAPGGTGSTDFIPIPDGWLVDGTYEEWTPPSGTDFTNPNPTANGGRYWKVYQSPVNPGMLRGILTFERLVKQITLPGNISTFVGSPITGQTLPATGLALAFDNPGSEGGIYGFNAGQNTGLNPVGIQFFDIISNQFQSFPTAIVLVPSFGIDSGDANSNFWSITMEMWTFPLVNPQTFPVGAPVNPFGLPKDVVVVNPPMNSVILTSVTALQQYWTAYMNNYRLTNSPRLRTTISVVYRGLIPQVGDALVVSGGLPRNTCGRIQTVSLNLTRSGLVLNIMAEVYQFGPGLYNSYPAIQQNF